MKQFTLLWIEMNELKLVCFKSFADFSSLLDYKNSKDCIKELKISNVDKEGYVWFCE